MAFADFGKRGVDGLKQNATNVLVRLMSDDSDAISIPVIFTHSVYPFWLM